MYLEGTNFVQNMDYALKKSHVNFISLDFISLPILIKRNPLLLFVLFLITSVIEANNSCSNVLAVIHCSMILHTRKSLLL